MKQSHSLACKLDLVHPSQTAALGAISSFLRIAACILENLDDLLMGASSSTKSRSRSRKSILIHLMSSSLFSPHLSHLSKYLKFITRTHRASVPRADNSGPLNYCLRIYMAHVCFAFGNEFGLARLSYALEPSRIITTLLLRNHWAR